MVHDSQGFPPGYLDMLTLALCDSATQVSHYAMPVDEYDPPKRWSVRNGRVVAGTDNEASKRE